MEIQTKDQPKVPTLKDIIDFVLYKDVDINKAIRREAEKIVTDYQERDIHKIIAVMILKGAAFVGVQLLLEIGRICSEIDYELSVVFDTMTISSYDDNAESSGECKLIQDMKNPSRGQELLFIEDIVDTGNQYNFLMELFSLDGRQPANIRFFSMIDKTARRLNKTIEIHYKCFVLEQNHFVAGRGLDWRYQYRNHPDIFVVKKEWQ